MKYILILILVMGGVIQAKAQFPGTDSLRNYNNKYITTNPATAFTNNRLNTLLRGIIDWVDTARAGTGGGGAVGVDTLWALNDSTIRYRDNGVFKNLVIKGVYDTRRKVDTAWAVNDTTLRITINGSIRNIILPGRPVTTYTNAPGSGDTLLTASNTIKRISSDNTITRSTNGNIILLSADTISWIASIPRLTDTARVLRDLIAASDQNLQQVTAIGNKTTDTIISSGLRTRDILGDTTDNDDFEIDVLPDLQYYTEFAATQYLDSMFNWIRDNRTSENIKAVLQVGDITDNATTTEFIRADTQFAKIDDDIPTLAVLGNHDYDGGINPAARGTTNYNTYFGPSRFVGKPYFGSSMEAGDNSNYYILFEAGGHKFITIGLEFIPRDTALNWAQKILDSLPDREAIIVTHAYLGHSNGYTNERSKDTSLHASIYFSMTGNDGEQMWDKLIKKNKQIFLVVSGHFINWPALWPVIGRQTAAGENGNVVNQIVCNYQSDTAFGNGYFMRLKFKPRENKLNVSFYSPFLQQNDSRYPSYDLAYPAVKIDAAVGIADLGGGLNVAGEARFDSSLSITKLPQGRVVVTGAAGKIDTLADQPAKYVLASPNAASGIVSPRLLVPSDIPILSNNGLSKNGDTVQLGQAIGAVGDPAKLNTHREIPLNGFNTLFTGTGNIGVGTTSPLFKGDYRGSLGVLASGFTSARTLLNANLPATFYVVSGGGNYGLAIQRGSADAGNGWLTFYKSRNADLSVATGGTQFDGIGTINWQTPTGNGASIVSVASIRVRMDTVLASVVGGEMLFATTDNTGFPSERARITSSGNFEISLNPGSAQSGRNFRLWVNGTVGVHKDSVPIVTSITREYITVLDTATMQLKRIAISNIAGSTTTLYNGDGSISGNRTVTLGSNILSFSSTQASSAAVSFANTGNGNAVSMSSSGSGATAVANNSGSGVGLQVSAVGGNGANISSDNATAANFTINPSSTNTVDRVANYIRRTTGTAAANMGGSIGYQLEDDGGASYSAAQIKWIQTNPAAASRTTSFIFSTLNAGTSNDRFSIQGTGQLREYAYGANTFTGTVPATTPVYSSNGTKGERIAPKIYTALITATAGNDPTPTILGTNEVGTIVWTRNSAGNYTGTLTGAFTANKTWTMINQGPDGGSGFVRGWLFYGTANTVTLRTQDNAGGDVDAFTNIPIRIEVYP